MTEAIRALVLAARTLWPAYDPGNVPALAVQHATPTISAPLLVAIAYHESRFVSTAVSRVKRRNGSTALFCGVTQATARDSADCVALQDNTTAIARTVDELQRWSAVCRRLHGVATMQCALQGYAEGMAGARRGTGPNARMKLLTARRLNNAS